MKRIFGKLNRFFTGKWQIAVLDLLKGRWFVETKDSCIPYLKAENARGRHILIRPLPEIEPFFLLVDDINAQLISCHHKHQDGTWKSGRMVIETSPGNYQVWIRSSRPLSLSEKRYWLHKLRSDPGADPHHRWGRCPGFRNRKEKHKDVHGGYPLARLIWIDWQKTTSIPHGDICAATLAPAFPPLPKGFVCHNRNISRQDYDRGDESVTDFAYALALVRRNYSAQQIKDFLIAERKDWQNHQGQRRMNDYIERTIAKARAIVRNSKQSL
ncbi:MAG: DNA-primase RepB domain-containing protein [Chloroflexota bacterium]|nr:DNA-primase RepB domain-containing protein [Chloroflexota bacterium]